MADRIIDIVLTQDGASQSIDLSQDQTRKSNWVVGVLAGSYGTMQAELEFSFENQNWAVVLDQDRVNIIFINNDASIVPAGLFYRVVITNIGTDVHFQARVV